MMDVDALCSTIKSSLVPFLPPPVVALVNAIDNAAPIGEASVKIIVSVLVLWLVNFLLQSVFRGGGRRRVKRDAVVLFGPSFSGKTVLFNALFGRSVRFTVTSVALTEQSGALQYSGSGGDDAAKKQADVTLIDHPGHPRLCGTVKSCLDRAKAVVFVIDSSKSGTFPLASRALYDIITDRSIKSVAEVLVCCNKSDLPLSKSAMRVKNAVTLELDVLRRNDEALAKTGGGRSDDRLPLGSLDEDDKFSIERDCNTKITFTSCSASSVDDRGLEEIRAFVNRFF